MGDENDCLAALFPDPLNISVKLLAGHGIKRGERFVHQQDAWIRRERTRERHALFHPARKLVHVCFHEFFQTNEMKKKFCHFAPLGIA